MDESEKGSRDRGRVPRAAPQLRIAARRAGRLSRRRSGPHGPRGPDDDAARLHAHSERPARRRGGASGGGLEGGSGTGESRCAMMLSLIHISEPTRLLSISYAVFCLKKKK